MYIYIIKVPADKSYIDNLCHKSIIYNNVEIDVKSTNERTQYLLINEVLSVYLKCVKLRIFVIEII